MGKLRNLHFLDRFNLVLKRYFLLLLHENFRREDGKRPFKKKSIGPFDNKVLQNQNRIRAERKLLCSFTVVQGGIFLVKEYKLH